MQEDKNNPSSRSKRTVGMKEIKSILSDKISGDNKQHQREDNSQENAFKMQNNDGFVSVSKLQLWQLFKKAYHIAHKKSFVETPDSLANIAPVIDYFIRDPGFYERKRLITRIGDVSLVPDFDKGLLIIGDYGNGKSTVMKALQLVFDHYRMPMRFKNYTAHDLVTEFERIGADPTYRESSRYQFYERLTKVKGLYIDDVKKERMASNFGKVNLIRDILEKRYDQKSVKTYITCNHREGDATCDLADALEEFGDLYGGHIYDRLFEMFNIIEFKGATFRK